MDHADFTRRQLDLRIGLFLAAQGRNLAGRTGDFRTAAGLHLDAADIDADRNILDRQPVARLQLGLRTVHDLVADLQADRSKDVRLLTVRIADQGDIRRTVRIVLDRDDLGRNVFLGADEIDHAVTALVAAPAETGRDPAGVIAAAGRLLAFQQTLLRLGRGDRGRIVQRRHMTPGGSHGIKTFNRHFLILPLFR